jgi:hypothetical protein
VDGQFHWSEECWESEESEEECEFTDGEDESDNRTGCDPTIEGGCCGHSLLALQPDFLAQKGCLEEVQARNHGLIFYPKFHCELNFIERLWCATKYFAWENCQYSLEKLRETIPAALDPASINRYYYLHCLRTMSAYRDERGYGTRVYRDSIKVTIKLYVS